jgi:hypothetical protein
MFDDVADGGRLDGFDFDKAESDREILYCIWVALETGDLDDSRGWSMLLARHPDDLPLLAASLWSDLYSGTYPDALMAKLEKVAAAKDALPKPVRQALLVEARKELERKVPVKDRTRFEELVDSAGPIDPETDLYEILNSFTWKLLQEWDAKTAPR